VLQEAELSGLADSENDLGGLLRDDMYYIGLDGSTRRELDAWVRTLPQPRVIAMEATIFTDGTTIKCEGGTPSDAASDRHGQEEE
jgi:hypothetical protein